MTTESTTSSITVTKEITVDCSQAHAFDVFTSRMSDWWPLDTHVIGAAPGRGVVIEPAPGGSWHEIDAEGKTCPWGRVLEWNSPDRVVLAWQLSAEWEYDPDFETEIHVTFTAESPDRTRVELQHRYLERYGDRAAEMEETFRSERAWQGMLALFATSAST